MIINIHLGEFCGRVERTQIDLLSPQKEQKESHPLYKFYLQPVIFTRKSSLMIPK
jgi:hypothetical protein